MKNYGKPVPKGTPPAPTRRNTKHKRPEFGRLLMAVAAQRRAWRFEHDPEWVERNKDRY